MSVFVTGGSGLVGREIVRQLVAGGEHVAALARSARAARVLVDLGVPEIVEGTVLDREAVARGIAGADVAYHVAGVNAFCLSDPGPMFLANIEGSRRVAEVASEQGLERLVYTSSAAVLGELPGTVGSETSVHRGHYLSDYEKSKHLAEQAVRGVADRTGLDVVYVLPSSVQGPGRAGGTAKLLLDVANGSLPAIVESRLSIVDAVDCAKGHVLAGERGRAGERYLLNGATMTVSEGLEMLSRLGGVDLDVRMLPGPAVVAGVTVFEAVERIRRRKPKFCREMVRTLLHGHAYDGGKASRELGLHYTPVEDTIVRTMRWFDEQGLLRRRLPGLAAG